MTTRHRSAVATAAYGLAGRTAVELAEDQALIDVELEGLDGLLWQAVEDGAVLGDAFAEEIARDQSAAMRACLRLEQRLLEVHHALAGAGVATRVLKGPATAHLDYPAPEWRPFKDIDLLVPAECLDDAVAVVEDMGGRRLFDEPRPGFAARFGKSVTVSHDDGIQVDLHRTLADGPYGQTIVAEELFDAPEPFTLAGRELLALRPEARFVHACVHTVLGRSRPELRPLRDVAQIDRRPGLDHDLVLDLTRRWRLEAVVARALELVDEHFGLEPALGPWAAAHRPDRFERRALPAYHGPSASYRHKAAATVLAIDGWGERVRYATALLFPSRGYLADREGSRWRRVRAGLGHWRSVATADRR